MIVFVEHINERIKYTFDFVFGNRSVSYVLTDNLETFNASDNFKFNFSTQHLSADAHLIPAQPISSKDNRIFESEKARFLEEDCLSFNQIVDPFSSIFYVLSRMEEYHTNDFDQHGRFRAKNSVLVKNDWLELAICDRWAEDILSFLVSKGFNYQKPKQYTVKTRPTFDIDNVYAYRLKTGKRKLLALLKDLVKGNKDRIKERKVVLAGKQKDPYDTFDYIQSISARGFEVNIFWLLGDLAKFDRNVSYKNYDHLLLIQQMSANATIGIHPSYKSASDSKIVGNEIGRLVTILSNEIQNSRQHFLRLKFPQTYHSLISNDVRHDFTMGYAELVGFRAGTARPFYWYDLSQERITNLLIHPFAYMDGTLLEYCHFSIEEANDEISKLYEEIQNFGGDFSFIWHNETIGNYGAWKGWSEVLEHSLNLKHE